MLISFSPFSSNISHCDWDQNGAMVLLEEKGGKCDQKYMISKKYTYLANVNLSNVNRYVRTPAKEVELMSPH